MLPVRSQSLGDLIQPFLSITQTRGSFLSALSAVRLRERRCSGWHWRPPGGLPGGGGDSRALGGRWDFGNRQNHSGGREGVKGMKGPKDGQGDRVTGECPVVGQLGGQGWAGDWCGWCERRPKGWTPGTRSRQASLVPPDSGVSHRDQQLQGHLESQRKAALAGRGQLPSDGRPAALPTGHCAGLPSAKHPVHQQTINAQGLIWASSHQSFNYSDLPPPGRALGCAGLTHTGQGR